MEVRAFADRYPAQALRVECIGSGDHTKPHFGEDSVGSVGEGCLQSKGSASADRVQGGIVDRDGYPDRVGAYRQPGCEVDRDLGDERVV